MSNEEYEEKIKELEEKIESLEEELQESEYLREEAEEKLTDVYSELHDIEDWREEKEGFAESCFNGGYDAAESGKPKMKSWLNFKIEARIWHLTTWYIIQYLKAV